MMGLCQLGSGSVFGFEIPPEHGVLLGIDRGRFCSIQVRMEWVGLNAITMYFEMLKCHFSVNITLRRIGRRNRSAIARV